MGIKVGKGLGKLLEAAGLAKEVPDEPAQPAPADENRVYAQNAGNKATAGEKAGLTARKKGTGTPSASYEKSVPADPEITETLKSGLGQAQSADVYQEFHENRDALTGFIEDESQRTQAAAKAAKLTRAQIELALSARLKKLDAEVEKMRSELLTDIRQKLDDSELELKQVSNSITAKEQELEALRNQADSLNARIGSARQQADKTQESIKSAYERLRVEIEAEQQLVKRSLK